MDPQLETQLQAWVDGELRGAEAEAAARQAASDPAARELCENLRSLQRVLRDNEPARPCPESRDFYWSRIRQGIEFEERKARREQTPARRGASARWLAWLLPAGALALAVSIFFRPDPKPAMPAASLGAMVNHYIEAPLTSVTTLTFYSAQDDLTVVWVGNVDLL